MLDQLKLIAEIEKNAQQLFISDHVASTMVCEQWALLSKDNAFLHTLSSFNDSPWPIPVWQGALNEVIAIPNINSVYDIVSVDGSQIYPERHIKSCCFLINIGAVRFSYQEKVSTVFFETIPLIYPLCGQAEAYSIDIINGIRHEQELAYGFKQAKLHFQSKKDCLLLFDGSFIFWHLDLQKGLRDRFLSTYLAHLLDGYINKIPAAAYISDPKSKELISILRLFLCNFDVDNSDLYSSVDNMVDAFLVQLYVPVGYRTTVFQNRSAISFAYPHQLRPHFFYINLGKEVARVEFPAWMAEESEIVNRLAAYIKDQALKGDGYPVILAEAHEQAVVKSADRDFFYSCLERIGQKYGLQDARMQCSQKLLHKRSMKI